MRLYLQIPVNPIINMKRTFLILFLFFAVIPLFSQNDMQRKNEIQLTVAPFYFYNLRQFKLPMLTGFSMKLPVCLTIVRQQKSWLLYRLGLDFNRDKRFEYDFKTTGPQDTVWIDHGFLNPRRISIGIKPGVAFQIPFRRSALRTCFDISTGFTHMTGIHYLYYYSNTINPSDRTLLRTESYEYSKNFLYFQALASIQYVYNISPRWMLSAELTDRIYFPIHSAPQYTTWNFYFSAGYRF